MRTALRAIWALLGPLAFLLCLGVGQRALADAPPRLALGLIVKLKGSSQGAASVVRLQASSLAEGSALQLRNRLAAASVRQRVGYTAQKPTAFAAQVIHFGHVMPYAEAQAQAERLRSDPDVAWVAVNELLQPASASTYVGQHVNPDDEYYAQQIWLQPRAQVPAAADFPAAWALMEGRTLSPVVVAVLDSGILYPADLDGRLLPGYDFVSQVDFSRDGNGLDSDPSDPGDWLFQADMQANPQLFASAACAVNPSSNWHGLAVSYMLAARTGNVVDGAGMLAPLPGAVVLPVRIAGNCGASLSDIIEGMLWAAGVDYQGSPAANAYPARIINFSFGSPSSCADTTAGSEGWLYRQTIASLKSKGTLLVASAGNGDEATRLGLSEATSPANCPGVLAVTGLNSQGFKALYANLVDASQQASLAVASGDITLSSDGTVSVWPGSGIMSLVNTGTQSPTPEFIMVSNLVGTSFAAPTAAGVAALMLAVDPSLTVDDLLSALTGTVQSFPAGPIGGVSAVCNAATAATRGNCLCTTQTCGAGMLDAPAAVAAAIAHADANPNAQPYAGVAQVASYFTPERLASGAASTTGDTSGGSSNGGGGGGGGSTDALTLGLLGLLCVGCVVARSGARQRLQRPGRA